MNTNFESRECQPKTSIFPQEITPRQLDETTPVQQEFIQGVDADRAILDQSNVESIINVAIKIGLVKPNETLSLIDIDTAIKFGLLKPNETLSQLESVTYMKKVTPPIIKDSVNDPNKSSLDPEGGRLVFKRLIFDRKIQERDDGRVEITQSEVRIAVIDGKLSLLQQNGSYLPIGEVHLKQTICEAIKNPIRTEIN